MLVLLLIIMIAYIIYVLHKWNEKAEKKLRELERNTFSKMNFNELEDYCDLLNESMTPKLKNIINNSRICITCNRRIT